MTFKYICVYSVLFILLVERVKPFSELNSSNASKKTCVLVLNSEHESRKPGEKSELYTFIFRKFVLHLNSCFNYPGITACDVNMCVSANVTLRLCAAGTLRPSSHLRIKWGT